MIKVGDYIKPKIDVNINDHFFGAQTNFPLEVKSITECSSKADHNLCKECPGHINEEKFCFGRIGSGYLVESISTDWDE